MRYRYASSTTGAVMASLILLGCGGASRAPSPASSTTPSRTPAASTPSVGTSAPDARSPGNRLARRRSSASPTASAGAAGPTKDEFINEADSVCQEAGRRLVALEKNAAPTTLQTTEGNSTAPNRLAMAMSMKSALTIDKPELAGLRALAPPRADRATVASYLSAFANEVSLTSRMVTALTDDDSSAIAQLGSQVQQGAANDEGLAQQYGFQVCSSSTG